MGALDHAVHVFAEAFHAQGSFLPHGAARAIQSRSRRSLALMEPVHAVIVLGAPTEPDGEPGHILAERLKAAERMFRSPGPGATAPSVLVLSGGAVASYGSADRDACHCVLQRSI